MIYHSISDKTLCFDPAFKGTSHEVVDFLKSELTHPIPGVPDLDRGRAVDGERKITLLKPLPTTSAGRDFELRSSVVGVYDKGKATVVETEQQLVDVGTEDVYMKSVGSAFYVGQGGWGGPKGQSMHSRFLLIIVQFSSYCVHTPC